MPLNEICTDRIFHGIKCAYSGGPVTVRVVASAGRPPCYFSPDAFDPAVDGFPSAKALLEALSRRDGVDGIATDPLVCPYTGERMVIHQAVGLFTAVGGFSPASLHPDRYELARGLMSRNGVVPRSAPVPVVVKAAAVEERERRPPIKRGADDFAIEEAARDLHAVLPQKTTVVVKTRPIRRTANRGRK